MIEEEADQITPDELRDSLARIRRGAELSVKRSRAMSLGIAITS
jgi:hypothetical protein